MEITREDTEKYGINNIKRNSVLSVPSVVNKNLMVVQAMSVRVCPRTAARSNLIEADLTNE